MRRRQAARRAHRGWTSWTQADPDAPCVRSAVIAFGFVIEKFNLFALAMARASSPDAGHRLQLERLSGPLGRYDGLAPRRSPMIRANPRTRIWSRGELVFV